MSPPDWDGHPLVPPWPRHTGDCRHCRGVWWYQRLDARTPAQRHRGSTRRRSGNIRPALSSTEWIARRSDSKVGAARQRPSRQPPTRRWPQRSTRKSFRLHRMPVDRSARRAASPVRSHRTRRGNSDRRLPTSRPARVNKASPSRRPNREHRRARSRASPASGLFSMASTGTTRQSQRHSRLARACWGILVGEDSATRATPGHPRRRRSQALRRS